MKNEETVQAVESVSGVREHILDAAAQLIFQKGVKATSLNDIAQAAGISKGTLYYYYRAKEDIVYDITDRNMVLISEELMSWVQHSDPKASPQQLLKIVFEKLVSCGTKGRLHLSLLNDAAVKGSRLAEKFSRRYEEWRQNVREALDRILPQNREHNRALSYLILAVLDGLIVQKTCGAQDIPIDEIVDMIFAAK